MTPNLIKAPASTSTPASGSEDIWHSLTVRGDHLTRLLAVNSLSDSTKDFLSGLEENCRRVLAKERVDLDVIKFTRQEVTEFLQGKSDFTCPYSKLVDEVCQRLKALERALQDKLEGERKAIWTKAVESLVEDYDSALRQPSETDDQNIKQTNNGQADDGHANDQRGNELTDGSSGDYNAYSRQIYEAISKLVEARCHQILQAEHKEGDSVILHQVSSRAKDSKSLHDKAKKVTERLSKEAVFNSRERLPQNLSEQVAEAKRRLINKIDDIAGARILVYFPDDVPEIVKRINESRALDIDQPSISFTKSRADHRQQDNEAIKEAYTQGGDDHFGMLKISDGAFLSEPTTMDDLPRRWMHSGYRAVHLTVTLAKDMTSVFNPQHDSKDQTQVPNENGQGVRAITPRDEFKAKLADIKRSWPHVRPIHAVGKKVEIQITSVVMHAWSQVEHDIIYKNPFELPPNGTMTRMLDAMNGQSLTSEVLLQEIRHATEGLKTTMDGEIKAPEVLRARLERIRREQMAGVDHDLRSNWTEVLFAVAKAIHDCSDTRVEHSIRRSRDNHLSLRWLYQFMPKGVPTTSTSMHDKPDLALAILRNTSDKVKASFNQSVVTGDSECKCASLKSGEECTTCTMLTLLRFSNAFSLMLAMDSYVVWKSLDERTSPWGQDLDVKTVITNVKAIYEIIQATPEPMVVEPGDFTRLMAFAQKFLTHSWTEAHEAAVLTTYAGCFLVDVDEGYPWSFWRFTRPKSLDTFWKDLAPLTFGHFPFVSRLRNPVVFPSRIGGKPSTTDEGHFTCKIVVSTPSWYKHNVKKGFPMNNE